MPCKFEKQRVIVQERKKRKENEEKKNEERKASNEQKQKTFIENQQGRSQVAYWMRAERKRVYSGTAWIRDYVQLEQAWTDRALPSEERCKS